jgi:integrase
MPPPKPPERQTFVPYVYSRAELRALLKAVAQDQHKRDRALDRQTLRTMILLLYGTGARMGEIINLLHDDVDLKGRLITISHPNSARSRSIPIGPDLCDVLSKYLSWRSRKNFQSTYLFITKSDTPVSRGSMTVAFQRLRYRLRGELRGDLTPVTDQDRGSLSRRGHNRLFITRRRRLHISWERSGVARHCGQRGQSKISTKSKALDAKKANRWFHQGTFAGSFR